MYEAALADMTDVMIETIFTFTVVYNNFTDKILPLVQGGLFEEHFLSNTSI